MPIVATKWNRLPNPFVDLPRHVDHRVGAHRADLVGTVHRGFALVRGRAGIRTRRALPRVPEPGLPRELRHGPRLLRTYRADESMDYRTAPWSATKTFEPVLDQLLAEPEVAAVDVRTVLPQCFLYAVTR
jgi:hypothetical protein